MREKVTSNFGKWSSWMGQTKRKRWVSWMRLERINFNRDGYLKG